MGPRTGLDAVAKRKIKEDEDKDSTPFLCETEWVLYSAVYIYIVYSASWWGLYIASK
jgi:hypothetical protein